MGRCKTQVAIFVLLGGDERLQYQRLERSQLRRRAGAGTAGSAVYRYDGSVVGIVIESAGQPIRNLKAPSIDSVIGDEINRRVCNATAMRGIVLPMACVLRPSVTWLSGNVEKAPWRRTGALRCGSCWVRRDRRGAPALFFSCPPPHPLSPPICSLGRLGSCTTSGHRIYLV